MKTKVMKSISKRIMTGFLAVAMVVTGIVVMPKEAKAEDITATAVFYDNEAKTYKISDYWKKKEDDRKVPVKSGYVFGGWYVTDENGEHTALKEADLENVENISAYDSSAYAKFVPAEVLSIKTQAALGDKEKQESSSLRILSTVDSLNYQQVGFEYKLGGNPEAQTGKGEIAPITKVYRAIKPNKDATADHLLWPTNEFVSGVSQYFIAADVSTILSTSEEKIVYARPFWVTMDGTEVMGLARNNRIVDKRNNNQYTSVAINLLTDGKAAAMVAAGKIQVKYNTQNYNVVGATADITSDATNGGKYLFPEMECHVDEDAGIITFVGNADIQEGVLTNLAADGLFANVRFEKAEDAESTELGFAINTEATDFCDWEENVVEKFVVQ